MTTAGNDAEIAYLESLLEAAINPQPGDLSQDCWHEVDNVLASYRQGRLTAEQMEMLVRLLAGMALSFEANAMVAEYSSPYPRRESILGLGG